MTDSLKQRKTLNWSKAQKQTIPPSTKSIDAMIHNESMTLRKAVSELLANALDQGAKWIDVSNSADAFEVTDDGNGCPRTTREMLRLGEHFSNSQRSTIGRFGVGFKDAVIWLGDRVEVNSLNLLGHQSAARADWQEMIRIGDWDAKFLEDSDRNEHGVTIRVTGLRQERFDRWDEVPEYISSLYSAAIDAGVIITVDGVKIKSIPHPILEDMAEFHGEYQGRLFEGICGILVDRKSARSGWDVRWGHLTIYNGYQKEGFHNYSPQGFYGRLLLKDNVSKWTLSRNKGEIAELAKLLNSPQIQEIIKPILDKLKNRGQTLQMKLNQKLAQKFCQNFLEVAKVRLTPDIEPTGGRTRTKPGRGGKVGVRGIDGTSPRRKSVQDENGSVREKLRKANEVEIQPHNNIESYGLGYVDITENGTLVKIFVEDVTPLGEYLWKTEGGRELLQHYAVGLLAIHFSLSKEQFEMPFLQEVTVSLSPEETQKVARVWSFCTQCCDFILAHKLTTKVA
jgi:hypothetical protein